MIDVSDVRSALSDRLNQRNIDELVRWVSESGAHREDILILSKSIDDRTSINALWVLTHLPASEREWLQTHQNSFIDMLLVETNPSKVRLLLKLLRTQDYEKDNIRADFLDYCLSKINSEIVPCAVRSHSIYCAFKMCRLYPELIEELEDYLELLSLQELSSGLMSALRNTRKAIIKMRRH